jgi:RecJ-like exonuclease
MDIEVTYLDTSGDEHTIELPAKMEVCHECGGTGSVLCEGMREHAYSAEEFAESFDDEEASEYFKAGGRYDVTCHVCKGKNVVKVIDHEKVLPESKEEYEAYLKYQDEVRQSRIDEAYERRYCC